MRNALRFFLLLLIVPAGLTQVQAQQDAHFSQYVFNGLVLNPAYAGSRGTFSSVLFYRNQWTGFDGAPITQSLSLHSPFGRGRYGAGFSVTNDKIGYINQTWMNASYAFRIPVGEYDLALGLQGGLLNYRINWPEAVVVDQNDQVIGADAQNIVLPNAGAGVWFANQRFYAGFSVPHIFDPKLINTNQNLSDVARVFRHYFFTTGIVLGLDNAVKWKPSLLFKYVDGAPLEVDINLMALIRERLWLGLSYRTGDAISFIADFQINRQIRLGYAYDQTLTALSNFNSGTHEVMLGFELFRKDSRMKSPRFF